MLYKRGNPAVTLQRKPLAGSRQSCSPGPATATRPPQRSHVRQGSNCLCWCCQPLAAWASGTPASPPRPSRGPRFVSNTSSSRHHGPDTPPSWLHYPRQMSAYLQPVWGLETLLHQTNFLSADSHSKILSSFKSAKEPLQLLYMT